MTHLGDIIQDLRAKAEISQDELSKRADLSLSMIVKLEADGGNPSRKTMKKIANAFGLKASDLEKRLERVEK